MYGYHARKNNSSILAVHDTQKNKHQPYSGRTFFRKSPMLSSSPGEAISFVEEGGDGVGRNRAKRDSMHRMGCAGVGAGGIEKNGPVVGLRFSCLYFHSFGVWCSAYVHRHRHNLRSPDKVKNTEAHAHQAFQRRNQH